MKKVILSCLMMLFVMSSFAQKKADRSASADTQALVEKYNLSNAQEAKMLKIQNRKFKNESEFASLENTNIDKYLKKKGANEEQTKFSILRLLNEEQRKEFKQNERDVRVKRATLSHKMLKEGASSTDIKKALLEIE